MIGDYNLNSTISSLNGEQIKIYTTPYYIPSIVNEPELYNSIIISSYYGDDQLQTLLVMSNGTTRVISESLTNSVVFKSLTDALGEISKYITDDLTSLVIKTSADAVKANTEELIINSENLISRFNEVKTTTDGLQTQIGEVKQTAQKLESKYSDVTEMDDKITSLSTDLIQTASEISSIAEKVETIPNTAENDISFATTGENVWSFCDFNESDASFVGSSYTVVSPCVTLLDNSTYGVLAFNTNHNKFGIKVYYGDTENFEINSNTSYNVYYSSASIDYSELCGSSRILGDNLGDLNGNATKVDIPTGNISVNNIVSNAAKSTNSNTCFYLPDGTNSCGYATESQLAAEENMLTQSLTSPTFKLINSSDILNYSTEYKKYWKKLEFPEGTKYFRIFFIGIGIEEKFTIYEPYFEHNTTTIREFDWKDVVTASSIKQTAEEITATITNSLNEKTGIDITNGTVNIEAKNFTVTNKGTNVISTEEDGQTTLKNVKVIGDVKANSFIAGDSEQNTGVKTEITNTNFNFYVSYFGDKPAAYFFYDNNNHTMNLAFAYWEKNDFGYKIIDFSYLQNMSTSNCANQTDATTFKYTLYPNSVEYVEGKTIGELLNNNVKTPIIHIDSVNSSIFSDGTINYSYNDIISTIPPANYNKYINISVFAYDISSNYNNFINDDTYRLNSSYILDDYIYETDYIYTNGNVKFCYTSMVKSSGGQTTYFKKILNNDYNDVTTYYGYTTKEGFSYNNVIKNCLPYKFSNTASMETCYAIIPTCNFITGKKNEDGSYIGTYLEFNTYMWNGLTEYNKLSNFDVSSNSNNGNTINKLYVNTETDKLTIDINNSIFNNFEKSNGNLYIYPYDINSNDETIIPINIQYDYDKCKLYKKLNLVYPHYDYRETINIDIYNDTIKVNGKIIYNENNQTLTIPFKINGNVNSYNNIYQILSNKLTSIIISQTSYNVYISNANDMYAFIINGINLDTNQHTINIPEDSITTSNNSTPSNPGYKILFNQTIIKRDYENNISIVTN